MPTSFKKYFCPPCVSKVPGAGFNPTFTVGYMFSTCMYGFPRGSPVSSHCDVAWLHKA